MSMNKNPGLGLNRASIHKQIMTEYERMRDKSSAELSARRNAVYKSLPQLQVINEDISKIGVKIARAVLQSPGDINELVKNLRIEQSALIESRAALLSGAGLPADYLEQRFNCDMCKDTGYVGSKPCKCLVQKRIDYAYDMSNLKAVIKHENFSTFNLGFFDRGVYPSEGISPYENMQKILSYSRRYIDSIIHRSDSESESGLKYNNMYLYGKPGLGKTFLCRCIAKELLDNQKNVLYTTAFQLFKMVEDDRFNRNDDYIPTDYFEYVMNCDLLIIDDLGTEFSTRLSSSEFFNFINIRLLEKRHTIISTNLSPSDLIEQYSDRVVSRIQGSFAVFKFFGEDIRIIKKYS